jgi:hypothetical protein
MRLLKLGEPAADGELDDSAIADALDELTTLFVRVVAAERISDRAPSSARQRKTLEELARRRRLTAADYRRLDDATQITLDRHYPGGARAMLRNGVRPELLPAAAQRAIAKLPRRRGRPGDTKRIAPQQLGLGLAYVFAQYRGEPRLRNANPVTVGDAPRAYGPFFEFVKWGISILRPHLDHVSSPEVVAKRGHELFGERRSSRDPTARFVLAGALPSRPAPRRRRPIPSLPSPTESRVREALRARGIVDGSADRIVELILDLRERSSLGGPYAARARSHSGRVLDALAEAAQDGSQAAYIVVRPGGEVRIGADLDRIASPSDQVLDLAALLEAA